jgi:uncharacterized membrane protein
MKLALTASRKRITTIFLQGLVAILPIVVTAWLLCWLATTAERFLGGLFRLLFPSLDYWPGLGVVLGLILVFGVGLLMNAWVMRRLMAAAEKLLGTIPLVKSIYLGIRDLAGFLSPEARRNGFQKVVSVTLMDKVRLVGFVTREDSRDLFEALDDKEELIAVYMPMSYQLGGFTAYLPRKALEPLNMSIEDAMRFTLTAGISR